MADMESIQKKQAEAARSMMKIAEEKDPKAILEMAEALQKQVGDLQKMALAFAAAVTPQDPEGQETMVKLTPDQKQRVTESTGVGIEVVTLRDTKKRVWSRELPLGRVAPREIEKAATKEAARLKLISETRTQVEKIIKQLEALNVPELAEPIAELRKDPTLGHGKKVK